MKAVKLATGRGSRLYPYTKCIPKCLHDVASDTIFERHINHIRACRIEELVIVVGFGLEKLENFQETTMDLDADTNTL